MKRFRFRLVFAITMLFILVGCDIYTGSSPGTTVPAEAQSSPQKEIVTAAQMEPSVTESPAVEKNEVANPTQVESPAATKEIAKATQIASPVATVDSKSYSYWYDFDNGISHWHGSGEEYIPYDLRLVGGPDYSLQVKTEVSIAKSLEVWLDFGRADLGGAAQRGPIDARGMTVSCWVNFQGSISNSTVRMLVRDHQSRNNWGTQIEIVDSMVGQWMQLDLRIGHGDVDSGFNPALTNVLGVRIDKYDDQEQKAVILIDTCTIAHS